MHGMMKKKTYHVDYYSTYDENGPDQVVKVPVENKQHH
jgi:hypothetical protein